MAVKYKKAEGKGLGLGPGGIGMAAGKGILKSGTRIWKGLKATMNPSSQARNVVSKALESGSKKIFKKLHGKRPKGAQTKTGEVRKEVKKTVKEGAFKDNKNPVAVKYGKTSQKPMRKHTARSPEKAKRAIMEARKKAQGVGSRSVKPKGSKLPIGVKGAAKKAMKATSEAGQRAIKAGTKSYKRFMVK